MHKDILSAKQKSLLPLLKIFSDDFGLVGGTAIALQLSHRESVDFDLFTNKKFDNLDIIKKIKKQFNIENVIFDKLDEWTAIINDVKVTFLYYPYAINYSKELDDIIQMPDILTLASMKAFALGRRAKWKDYVDLYFVFKDHETIESVIKKAKEMFKTEFNEKQFLVQLSYFKDIDFSEKVKYFKNFEVEDNIIKETLKEISLIKL